MRMVPNGGPPVGPLTVFVWVALAGPKPPPGDVSWTASVPLWTSLSPAGKVVAAGPASWASPPPAARLGPPPPPTPLPPGERRGPPPGPPPGAPAAPDAAPAGVARNGRHRGRRPAAGLARPAARY